MKIESLSLEQYEAYDEYILGKEGSLLYYSTKYKDFLKSLLGCQEKYLLAIDGGKIQGVLPLMFNETGYGRVYNSLPYYGSNGGGIADNSQAYRLLVHTYNKMAVHDTTISSTIIGNPLLEQDGTYLKHNYHDYRISQITRMNPTKNFWDEIMSSIDSSARRNIKKALQGGVTVEIDHTQVDTLRQIHQDNIRAMGGIPKTDQFFHLVPRFFKPGIDFDLYVAKKDGLIIAGLLLFYFNRTVEYFTPAVVAEYRSLQPLSLVIITAMVDATQRGFTKWNWGGTWENQVGLYRFKRKWASVEKKYFYYTQLNDRSILTWSKGNILANFPSFFVVPFSELNVRKLK